MYYCMHTSWQPVNGTNEKWMSESEWQRQRQQTETLGNPLKQKQYAHRKDGKKWNRRIIECHLGLTHHNIIISYRSQTCGTCAASYKW